MTKRIDISTHSDEMALMGEKYALLKTQAHLNKEIGKINNKLETINKKKMFKVLKGDQNELKSKKTG